MSSNEKTTAAELLDSVSAAQVLDALKLRLAHQIAPRRWRSCLMDMACRVEAGQPMDEAFRTTETQWPGELRSLMRESLRVTDPGALLVESLRIRSEVRNGWREFIRLSVYPALLFVFALTVGIVFSYCMRYMVDLEWVESFGLSGVGQIQSTIEDQHHAIVGLGMITAWVLLIMLTILVVGPAWAWVAVVGGMIVLGKPLRWLSLQEILLRYQLFIDQGLSSTELSATVARSFGSSSQSVVVRAVARRVAAGMTLARAIAASMLTDGLCRPAILLLDQRSEDLHAALGETAELVGSMAEERCRTLATIVPVFVLAVVGTILWGALSSYLLGIVPLVSLISGLA